MKLWIIEGDDLDDEERAAIVPMRSISSTRNPSGMTPLLERETDADVQRQARRDAADVAMDRYADL